MYSVRYGEEPFELSDYDEGVDLALTTLPTPDPGAGRPGLGFVIVHRGRGVDYVVLAWWDRENELTVRVFVRD
ncbi:MAG: isochorismatase, partial [Gemmatimonadota bacterium]